MGARSRSRSRRRRRSSPVRKRAPSQSSSDGNDAEDNQELPLHAKYALLEVENTTLKAEIAALRKKLVEALCATPASTGAKQRSSSTRQREDTGGNKEARAAAVPDPVPSDPAAERRRRLGIAEKERSGKAEAGSDSDHERQRRRRPERVTETVTSERNERTSERNERLKKNGDDEEADVPPPNAVMLANDAMEAYNGPQIPNNIPLEQRLPLVQKKLDQFMGYFDDKITIFDAKSGKPIIKDRKVFLMRYSCVFRESGSSLKGSVTKRFYYDAPGSNATYVMDYETHDNLVTAKAGMRPDGSMGVNDPRTQLLITLYEAKGGKLTRMWLTPDTDKMGPDPTAGEDILTRQESFQMLEGKIAELRGGKAGERIFNNYHNTPVVG